MHVRHSWPTLLAIEVCPRDYLLALPIDICTVCTQLAKHIYAINLLSISICYQYQYAINMLSILISINTFKTYAINGIGKQWMTHIMHRTMLLTQPTTSMIMLMFSFMPCIYVKQWPRQVTLCQPRHCCTTRISNMYIWNHTDGSVSTNWEFSECTTCVGHTSFVYRYMYKMIVLT